MFHLNRLHIQRSVANTVSTEQGSFKMFIEGRIWSLQISGSLASYLRKLGCKNPRAPPYHHLQMLNENSSWSHVVETLGHVRKACAAPGGGNEVCHYAGRGFHLKGHFLDFQMSPELWQALKSPRLFWTEFCGETWKTEEACHVLSMCSIVPILAECCTTAQ